jgi:hypothetical protein
LDPQIRIVPFGFVILLEPRAEAAGFHPHDRVDSGIERRAPLEHNDPDSVFFQQVFASGKPFFHQMP